MKTPEDILRRLGENVKFGTAGGSDTLTQAQVLGALGRMDPKEAHQSLDELEQDIEIQRLKVFWDGVSALDNSHLSAALGPNFKSVVAEAIEEMRTAKGEARRRALKKIKSLSHRIQRQQGIAHQQAVELARRLEQYDRCAAEVNRFLNGPLTLQRLEGSHFRRLLEAERVRDVFTSVHKGREAEYMPNDMISLTYGDASVFVVEHDWARAFESAPDVFKGPVMLPDTQCIFEFCISGHIVVAMIGQVDAGPTILPFVRTKEGWVTIGTMISRDGQIGTIKALDTNDLSILIHEPGDGLAGTFVPLRLDHDTHRLYTLIDRQIRAVGVALDAQVAVKTAVRMPYKSNQPPKGPAKPKPFYSYHTVSLARRAARLEARDDDGLLVQGPKRRLHFRRGHWRHFDGWKTWVNWCLVGDPDLGFVDKHYRL